MGLMFVLTLLFGVAVGAALGWALSRPVQPVEDPEDWVLWEDQITAQ